MEKDQVEELVILHFNDAYNIQPNDQGLGGFVNFYEYVQNMRQKYKNSLLVFSGDAFAPSKLSRVLKGEQMVHCIKMLNIDVACYGNHEFDFEPAHCMKLAKSCEFPWLMSNIKYIDTNRNIGDGLEYFIVDRCGVKIGFLGLAGPDFNGRLISDYKGKLKYIAIAEHAKKICNILIQKNCQLIVALTHCRRPADEELAAKVPQIDIILGGHDHHQFMEVINKIPIVKSGSDFEMMSIIKIKQGQLNDKVKEKLVVGRKWNFDIKCKLIKKSQKQYPELTQYIQNAVNAYKEYQKNKSRTNNKQKPVKVVQYPDEWLLSYHFLNSRPAITLKAGLSAEVCFAKYVAFKKNMFYVGYKRGAPKITDNFVEENLEFVYKQVKSHMNQGKTILYSPGICSVPYLVETGNLIYLPSHFLVGINSFKDLERILYIAHDKGYRCYAVVGYDPFIKDQLCAWIKFTHPPIQYLKLIEQLQIENVLFMSVHNLKSEQHGSERNARLISGADIQLQRKAPLSRDIYLLYVKQGYGDLMAKDIAVFKKIVKQLSDGDWMELSKKPLIPYIHDWESGIDCIDYLESRFRVELSSQKVQFYYLLHADSFKLYMCAYYLGKVFITHNYNEQKHPVVAQGIVFNQYFINNPTYELNYGYIPILYWQFYPKNEERLKSFLTEEEFNLKRWFNMHKGTTAPFIQKDSFKVSTTHEGLELAKWITRYAPKQYILKYLSIDLILKTLGTYKLIYVNQNIQNQHATFIQISQN